MADASTMFLTMKRLMALSLATSTPDASQRTRLTCTCQIPIRRQLACCCRPMRPHSLRIYPTHYPAWHGDSDLMQTPNHALVLDPACKPLYAEGPRAAASVLYSPHGVLNHSMYGHRSEGPRAYMASAVLAPSIISSLLAHTGQPPATATVPAERLSHLKDAHMQPTAPESSSVRPINGHYRRAQCACGSRECVALVSLSQSHLGVSERVMCGCLAWQC